MGRNVKGALPGLRQFLSTKSHLKNDEKCSYFTLKALFVFKMFKFFLNFLVMQKIGFFQKIRSIPKFMTLQPGKQTIAIHIVQYFKK